MNSLLTNPIHLHLCFSYKIIYTSNCARGNKHWHQFHVCKNSLQNAFSYLLIKDNFFIDITWVFFSSLLDTYLGLGPWPGSKLKLYSSENYMYQPSERHLVHRAPNTRINARCILALLNYFLFGLSHPFCIVTSATVTENRTLFPEAIVIITLNNRSL